MRMVTGSELRIGDAIGVWWGDKRDTIRRFKTRKGGHPDLQRIAVFASGNGMTICRFEQYRIIE